MRETAKILFTGTFVPEHFGEFIDHRARRLDLDVNVAEAGAERFSVSVSGEPDLIDAFEMACSLGPLDCLVLDVRRLGEMTGSKGAAYDG